MILLPHRTAVDQAECASLARKHARTFATASRFLPRHKRRAAFAVYAFCRIADDYVDEAGTDIAGAERRLDAHHRAFDDAMHGGAESAMFRELQWAVETFDIPAEPFESLMDMLRRDLVPARYERWSELQRYCGGVASTVGVICAHVFGLPESAPARADALRYARILGVALQLTNILRDVGEDAARDRCYLPREDLSAFGITVDDVLSGGVVAREERWRAFMQFQIARSRELYQQAAPGIALLDRDAQCCATICSTGYAQILQALEQRQYDSLRERARVNTLSKCLIMLRAWRDTPYPAVPDSTRRHALASEHAMEIGP